MSERDWLNRRLLELAVSTPYTHDEWVGAAQHLGDKAEALLPSLEAMVLGGYFTPRSAAQSVALFAYAREPRRDDNEHGGASRPEQADHE